MVGWHYQLNGHGFGQTPGVDEGQGGRACCGSWGHKESDTTKRLNLNICSQGIEIRAHQGHEESVAAIQDIKRADYIHEGGECF